MYRFRYLDEADQTRWPDWYEVDMGAYHLMDSGAVMAWEEATGYLIMDLDEGSPTNVAEAAKRRSMKAMLAVQWLAVLLAGDRTPWEQFRPKVFQVEFPPELIEEAKAGNPAGPATNRAARRAKSASVAATSPRARKAAQRRSGS